MNLQLPKKPGCPVCLNQTSMISKTSWLEWIVFRALVIINKNKINMTNTVGDRTEPTMYAVFRNGFRVSDSEYDSKMDAQRELSYWRISSTVIQTAAGLRFAR